MPIAKTPAVKTATAAKPFRPVRKTAALPAKHIAVIGGGPKAVALAVKAHVLRELGLKNVHVTIFEPSGIGAAWQGVDGFTDGEQLLCTLAERDLGFPYENVHYHGTGKDVAAAMWAYSWKSFLLSANESERPYTYGQWVNAGRRPPKHRDFARYLQWALKQTPTTTQVVGWVSKVHAVGKQWQLDVAPHETGVAGTPYSGQLFDGVVVTGTGPARKMKTTDQRGAAKAGQPVALYDGRTFWQNTAKVRDLLAATTSTAAYDEEIVIAGAGGTGAAILAWLLANGGANRSIVLLAKQAPLYTRVDSVFENKLFTDSDGWNELSRDNQRAFFTRLNRGVVWDTVIDRVSAAERLVVHAAEAELVTIKPDGSLNVDFTLGNGTLLDSQPLLMVDGTGFNAYWFLDLLGSAKPNKTLLAELEETMDDSLSFQSSRWNFPRLHVPMLSSRVGPGYGSLMVLGAMADRILSVY